MDNFIEGVKARAYSVYLDARVVAADVVILSGHISVLLLSIFDLVGVYDEFAQWIDNKIKALLKSVKK